MKAGLYVDPLITPWCLFSQFCRHHEDITPCNLLQINLLRNFSAEGGTRTRTAFWARGFSYHYSFRHLPSFWSPFGFDSLWSGRCLLRACFFACFVEQVNKPCLGGSRLV